MRSKTRRNIRRGGDREVAFLRPATLVALMTWLLVARSLRPAEGSSLGAVGPPGAVIHEPLQNSQPVILFM